VFKLHQVYNPLNLVCSSALRCTICTIS